MSLLDTIRARLLLTLLVISVSQLLAQQLIANDHATIVVNGRVWTADSEQSWAESIAIGSERILAVGTESDTQPYLGPETRVVDAGDGLVVPGLIDSHIHLVTGGANLTSVKLRDASSPEEFAKRISDFAATIPPGTWITGGDWDHTLWGGELPTRSWIDKYTPAHPVWLQRLDGHMALANSVALQRAGISDDVKEVSGGDIVRDDEGRLTGVLKDNAMSLVEKAVPPPTLPQRLSAIRAAVAYLAAQGVTAVHHMGDWEELEALRVAYSRNILNIRVYACTPLPEWQRLAQEVKKKGRGDLWLSIGGLKGFVDGSLGSHTAAFLEPYTDTPGQRGLLVTSKENLQKWTTEADKAGLQVVVHAIGDRAIRLQLDVYEEVIRENGPRDRRFRIEHAQHIHPNDLPRFKELGVIASMQPYHAIDDGRWADGVIGPERSKTTYAFRSLCDTGAKIALGSDWFVAPPTPLEGIYAAVTRRTLDGAHPDGWVPEQKITVSEALRGYTIDAAYAGFMEKETGSLEVGKQADFVVLDRDITSIAPEDISETQVVMTVIGGKVVFEKRN